MSCQTTSRPLWALLALLIALGVPASCTTLTKRDCQISDWRATGARDGAWGEPVSRIDGYAKACGKYSLVPDKKAWLEGHKAGARRYCTPSNAYRVGKSGLKYHNICAADQHEVFLSVYNVGQYEYLLGKKIQLLQGRLINLEFDTEELDDKVAAGELDESLLESEKDRLKSDIAHTESDLRQAAFELRQFRQQLLRDGYMKMANQ